MIRVEGLTKRYDSTLAVDEISFEVGEGEVFGFIGPNGAGKTTTIRVLATLLDPTDGKAWIAGHSVTKEPEKVRHSIGYMPDYFGVYDGIRVWEYLDFFAGAFKIPRRDRARIIEDVMELTDLTKLRERMVSELSKGMKQRLCLAKTLIHDPKVLILDEPASGLDPRARIEIRALLKELSNMGKTIFISSHILTELSDICTSVGIIEKGRIIAAGKVEVIQAQLMPIRTVTIKVLNRAEDARNLLEDLPDALSVVQEENVLKVELQGSEEGISAIAKLLTENQIPIVGLEEEKPDLEDLFMRITKGDVA